MVQNFVTFTLIGMLSLWNTASTQELTSFEDRQFNHDPSADLSPSGNSDVGPALTRQKKTSPAPITLKPAGSRALESFEDDHQSYNSGVQFRAYGDQGTGRSSDGSNPRWPTTKKRQIPPLPPIATKQPQKGPPPIDENFVSALFKHPEAIKIVYDYLEEQKAFSTTPAPTTVTTTKPTTTTTTTQRTTTSTQRASLKSTFPLQPPPKPLSASQAKINRLNSLFGLALLGENAQNSHSKTKSDPESDKPQEVKREKFPSLANIFGSLEKLESQPNRQSIFNFQRPSEPPTKPEKVENPLLNGQKKPDLQFFGPKDFVPKTKFSLPVHTNGPLQLKYVSAKDFPFNTPFGIVPIPR